MSHRLQAGQQFTWKSATDDASGTAVVRAIRNDRQEGLGPGAEDYAALWMDSMGLSGSHAGVPFSVLLATDGKTYLDGQQVHIDAG